MSNTKIICEICQGKYLFKNRKRHFATRKHMKMVNPAPEKEKDLSKEIERKEKALSKDLSKDLSKVEALFEKLKTDLTPEEMRELFVLMAAEKREPVREKEKAPQPKEEKEKEALHIGENNRIISVTEIEKPKEEKEKEVEKREMVNLSDRDVKLMELRQHMVKMHSKWRDEDPFFNDLSPEWKEKMIKDEETRFLAGTGFTLVIPAPEKENEIEEKEKEETPLDRRNRKRRENYAKKKEKERAGRDAAIIKDMLN